MSKFERAPAREWPYGDCWERYPIEAGEVWGIREPLSQVAVHDIYEPLPAFMRRADLLFVDPPWTDANINAFYTKAGLSTYRRFTEFLDVLIAAIEEIGPRVCYVEMGYQNAELVKSRLPFPTVQEWPVTYYRKHPCVLLRGSLDGPAEWDYTGIDEAECIKRLAAQEAYSCLGDLCMGRGLAGMAAFRAGKPFVGTELSRRRLANLLDNLAKAGAHVRRLAP